VRDDGSRGRGRPSALRVIALRYMGGDLVVYLAPHGVRGPHAIERMGRPVYLRRRGQWFEFLTLRPIEGLRFRRLRILKQARLSPARPEPRPATVGGQLSLMDVWERGEQT
jgi:hypothetical protein